MSHLNTPTTRKPDDYYYDADSLWGRESKRLLVACLADPSNRQLRADLAWAEKQREETFEKVREKWNREQDREYAAQAAGMWGGDDHVFDTMSGGTIVR